jgi:hypothetical protein
MPPFYATHGPSRQWSASRSPCVGHGRCGRSKQQQQQQQLTLCGGRGGSPSFLLRSIAGSIVANVLCAMASSAVRSPLWRTIRAPFLAAFWGTTVHSVQRTKHLRSAKLWYLVFKMPPRNSLSKRLMGFDGKDIYSEQGNCSRTQRAVTCKTHYPLMDFATPHSMRVAYALCASGRVVPPESSESDTLPF